MIMKDEKYFSNPEKFDPENFSPEKKAERSPYAFLVQLSLFIWHLINGKKI